MQLTFNEVRMQIGAVRIVQNVTFRVEPGELAGVIGPNGSGKSTLLRAAYRHLRPAAGVVHAGDDDAWKLSNKASALRVAAVPQERSSEFDFTVREMVAMGRIPHSTLFGSASADTPRKVDAAMERVGIMEFADRLFATLSGGERQRVLLARALAQDTPILILDEPTNHLDIRHQLELLDLLRALRLTTLIAIHDLNLAAAFCDRLHLMFQGQLVASGTPTDVLTPALIAQVFEVDANVHIGGEGSLRLEFKPLQRKGETKHEK